MESAYIDKVLSLEEWKSLNETTTEPDFQPSLKTLRTGRKPKQRHNPQDEKTPSHGFYSMDTKNMDEKTGQLLEQLVALLRQPEYTHLDEIKMLIEKLNKLATGPPKHDWSYALVGNHGEGKSTVVNCLLGRANLASRSDGTKSCTQYATRYEHLPGAPDNVNTSNVTLQFFNRKERSKTTQEHMERIYRVRHASDRVNDELDDESGIKITNCDKRLCEEGIGFLKISVQGNNTTEEELEKLISNPTSFKDGSLQEWCLRKQDEQLKKLGVDDNSTITFFNIFDKADPQDKESDHDMVAIRKIAESLAPLLDTVIVATGGVLLSHGLVFLDIPGYGDRSQIRIASANAHRRGAHGELVVAAAKRVEDSDAVDNSVLQSIRAHGYKNTTLVVNMIDAMEDLDGNDLCDMLDSNTGHPFIDIKLEQMKTDDLYKNGDQSEATILTRYDRYLFTRAQSAAKRYMIGDAVTRLMQQYKGRISVIPTSASSYHQFLDPNCSEDPAFGVNMSGIPHLRQTLLSMIADQKFQIYRDHYFETLPSIVDTVQRITTKTSDRTGVLVTYRVSILHYFKNAMCASRAAKKLSILTMIIPLFTISEKLSITKRVHSTIHAWSDSHIVRWPTFQHTLWHRGIPISLHSKAYRNRESVNWNRDLLETMERPAKINTISDSYPSPKEHISYWKSKMLAQTAEITNDIVEPISELLIRIKDVIGKSDAPLVLKKRTLVGWQKVEISIRGLIKRFPEQVKAAIEHVYRIITTEEDIGCMIAEMNVPLYDAAGNQPRGPGVYARCRQSLLRSLCEIKLDGQTFVDRYETLANQKTTEHLAAAMEKFITEVETKITGFIDVMEAFKKTEIHETGEHIAARKVLCKWLPRFQDHLLDCQQRFPEQHKQQEDQFVRSIKRSNINKLESPVKRMKTE